MGTGVAVASTVEAEEHTRRPLMSTRNILFMNVGFFGVQYSFGLTQTAVNPLFTMIGANAHDLPILNLAGPITGLFIQPLIGAMSDKTWSPRWGRRKPFVLAGALTCIIVLFLFPMVTALWMAVLCLWLLDAGNNTAMEPYRALISDRLPKSQLARGFLTQSLFTGAGAVLANVSLFVFQELISGSTAAGVPYWVFASFWLGAVCCLVTVSFAMWRTREVEPTAQELAELRSASKGLGSSVAEIAAAVRVMPVGMHKIGLAFLFQWYAMFIYWQFVAVSVGETAFGAAPEDPGYDAAVGWSGLLNGSYNFWTMVTAMFLMPLCLRFGGKKVHAGCLLLAAVSLLALANMSNPYLMFLPMIGFGICWASMVGVPYLMVASMVPRERTGVYMGILNMMIVVPMLIQTLTFGWIFENLLGGSGANAIVLAGALLACAALAMLWVNPPRGDEESPIMPLGPQRDITVYDRVLVGSDGSPAALYAVTRAHAVAEAAEARMVVVSAFDADDGGATGEQTVGGRTLLYGEQAARAAVHRAVEEITSDRIRAVEQVVVQARPAEALLQAAGDNPHSLIVVGNRGLGAAEGEVLGSVPREIVRNAVCDVLVVQVEQESEAAPPVD